MSDDQKKMSDPASGLPQQDAGEPLGEPTGDVAAQAAMDEKAVGELNTAGEMVTELAKERDANLAGWKQALADYANLKRESEKGASEIGKYASAGVVSGLLPVLDSFSKALAVRPAPGADYAAFNKWADGVALIKAQLDGLFAKLGVSPIDGAGIAFDSQLHEAMMMEPPTDEHKAGTVVRVLETGYKMNDRVIRPAKVVVAE